MYSKPLMSCAGIFAGLLVFLTVLSSLTTFAVADHRVRPIASDLSARVDHVWQAAQNRLQERYYQGPDGESAMMLYMALSNFANSARLYKSFAGSFADENLRGGAKSLFQQAEIIDRFMDRAGVFGHLREDWRKAQDRLGALAAELRIDSHYARYHDQRSEGDHHGGGDRRGRHEGGPHGIFRWRGEVDGEDLIKLRGRDVWIEHRTAGPVVNASHDLTAPFPRSGARCELKKHRGRGRIDLVEQPSVHNDFTATIRVKDEKGGTDLYEFELIW